MCENMNGASINGYGDMINNSSEYVTPQKQKQQDFMSNGNGMAGHNEFNCPEINRTFLATLPSEQHLLNTRAIDFTSDFVNDDL